VSFDMAGDEYFKHMIGRVIYRFAVTDFIIFIILRPVSIFGVLELGGGRDGTASARTAQSEAVSADLTCRLQHHHTASPTCSRLAKPSLSTGWSFFISRWCSCWQSLEVSDGYPHLMHRRY
jgi:hypothetical protein